MIDFVCLGFVSKAVEVALTLTAAFLMLLPLILALEADFGISDLADFFVLFFLLEDFLQSLDKIITNSASSSQKYMGRPMKIGRKDDFFYLNN